MLKSSIDMAENIDIVKPSGYVFKVLSGAMHGIEFSLGSHAYFICVSNPEGQENLAQNLQYAERTLYLPTANPGNNFVVNLADEVTEDQFVVTVSHSDRQETVNFGFNVICQVEGIYFALKREGEAWSENVLKEVLPAVVKAEIDTVSTLPASHSSNLSSSSFKYKWVIAASLALSLGAGFFVWHKYGVAPPDLAANMLQQLDNNAGYSIQQGRDNIYYLFAQNSQQAEWARRSVARLSSNESWKVLTTQDELTRLTRVMDRNNISFFTIRFNELDAPTLVMSSTRSATDPAALERVKKVLLDAIPYAKKVNIELKSDQEILHLAEEGLAALGFNFQMTQSDSGVTLSSSIAAEDSRMAEFNLFVAQFKRLWGHQYVHFSVELQDDVLKENSYKYGENGYVKLGKSHWLFNP
ncbi:MAG: hypothetical protein K0R08_2234 [Solimicrobium sp.]|nr:hypothetical protein [Solimicrobium sp.]